MKSVRKILVSIGLLVSSSICTAEIISYHGYTHDTSTNYVTGGGLEWLQWTATIGLTFNEAMEQYSADGYRFATANDMQGIFNSFGWGGTLDVTTGGRQLEILVDEEDSFGLANEFIALFGDTYDASGLFYSVNGRDRHELSRVYYLNGEAFGNPYIRSFSVADEYWVQTDSRYPAYLSPGWARLDRDYLGYYDTIGYRASMYGIALVRDAADDDTTSVSEPALSSLYLLTFFLLLRLKA